MTANHPLHILIVDDLPTTADLVQRELAHTLPDSVCERAATREAYLVLLAHFQPRLIIADCALSQLDGLMVLRDAALLAPHVPILILTAARNEDLALACVQAGAFDYVFKEQPRRLGMAVGRVLAEHGLHGAPEDARAAPDHSTLTRLEQMLQSQKLESIGRLAGGVAHDFNNLLTVIQGYCDLIEAAISQGTPILEELEQIRLASQRAASLTRQLLAFSRKQLLSPVTLALAGVVENLRKMLDRLIGEDIKLITALDPQLRLVLADPSQIEQVLMNLVINARDAMPTGGTLKIAAENVDLDADDAVAHPDLPPGQYVLLTVSDTGDGMDEHTQAQIFEPFFTTKGLGYGTGLGLATVYGIIKQSGGEISVTSRPAQGTTFHILLPASSGAADAPVAVPAPTAVRGGSETILLVEDDGLVRGLVRTVLCKHGYRVLEAMKGLDALAIARQHPDSIDLLMTDVVVPQLSGPDLAEQIRQVRPQTKVLFMSGYTEDAVVRHGLLMSEVAFLDKPFSPLRLAARVREVLDAARPADVQLAQGHYQQTRDMLTRLLDSVPGAAAHTRSFAQALVAQGNMLAITCDLTAATEHFARGLAVFQALGDRSGQISVLERLGWVSRERGDAATAQLWLERGLALSREIGDQQQIAWLVLTLIEVAVLREDVAAAEALIVQARALHLEMYDWIGWFLDHQGHAAQLAAEYSRAEQLHHESLAVFRERLGEKSVGVLWAYQGLGEAALGQGDAPAAHGWLCAALQLGVELGSQIMIAWCLAGLGSVAALSDDPVRAVRLWAMAEHLRARLGSRAAPAARATYERLCARVRAQLGEEAFGAAWAAGAALTFEQVLELALGDEPAR